MSKKSGGSRSKTEKWKLDVNDRYQRAVGVIIGLATAGLALPIFFLKDIVGKGNREASADSSGQAIIDFINNDVVFGWVLLGISILCGIFYHYCSAKWVKLALGKKTDMFWISVRSPLVEKLLDFSYFIMMGGFVFGMLLIFGFMATYVK